MALRKLQGEIDRTLKSVATGVEVFEATFDKLNHASNTTQKDKLENDLKTQIKKLQRMRDQIKAWLGNGDIKDKTQLLDNRRLIETQMERFKALEKETKMKAFSKEGLIAQSKLDPAEKAKRNMIDWIGTITDELSRQVEQTEAEVETLQATKKKKQAGERLDQLEGLNERREWHLGRLEIVQRMLENGQLATVDVEAIQEDVKYFVEDNMEDEFEYDAGIYDELNLQDLEEDYIHDFTHDQLDAPDSPSPEPTPSLPATVPKTPVKPSSSVPSEKATPVKEPSLAGDDEIPSSPVAKKTPLRKTTLDKEKEKEKKREEREKKEREDREREDKERAASSLPTPIKAAPLPPIRYAAAAAAAVAGTAASAPALTIPHVDESPKEEVPEESAQTSSLPPPPPPGLTPSPVQASQPEFQDPSPVHTANATPALSERESFSSPAQAPASTPGQDAFAPLGDDVPYSFDPAESSRSAQLSSTPVLAQPPHLQTLPHPGQPQQQVPQGQQTGVMGNLMQSFEVAKEISKRRGDDANGNDLYAALEGSFGNAPAQLDAEPPRYYHPKNPVKTPSYYPQAPLPILSPSTNPALPPSSTNLQTLFSQLELDQLFYIFYYMTGTYHQFLAARELKKQSWRFHKQYLTWFQRAHNPQAITSDYEQGGYYYFDWENSWCQRRKSDFRFEYRWLSDH